MKHNLPESLKTDRRFEALVKQEMAEHQAVISSHHKEMQALRDALAMAMERFTSLFGHAESQMKKQNDDFGLLILQLQEKMRNHDLLSSGQKKTLLSFYDELNQFRGVYAQKSDVEKSKTELSNLVQQTTTGHINAFQSCEQELKSVIHSLKNDLTSFESEVNERFSELDKKVETGVSLSSMDKEGIFKGIRAYDKTLFIMEKKIENIYTLIERINKKE